MVRAINLLIILLVTIYPYNSKGLRVRCPLEWIKFNPETIDSLKEQLVPAYGTAFYVARAKLNGTFSVGYMEIQSQEAFIPMPPFRFAEFELLYNKNKCTWSWSGSHRDEDKKLLVPVDYNSDNGKIISRLNLPFAILDEFKLVGVGEVGVDKVLTFVVHSTAKPESSSNFSSLLSYSKGLNLQLKNFIFANDSSVADFRVVNVETIENYANVVASQVVVHSKTISSSYSFTESKSKTKSWGVAASISVSAGFKGAEIGGSLSAGYSDSTEDNWSNTLSTSSTSIITISKNISVGPFESVLACSSIKLNDNFVSTYEAVAEYTAPGLNGTEIMEALESVGYTNITMNANSASMIVAGEYTGAGSLSTNFFVTPKDAIINCRNMKEFQ